MPILPSRKEDIQRLVHRRPPSSPRALRSPASIPVLHGLLLRLQRAAHDETRAYLWPSRDSGAGFMTFGTCWRRGALRLPSSRRPKGSETRPSSHASPPSRPKIPRGSEGARDAFGEIANRGSGATAAS
jgi:hypothetical protein